MGYLFYNIHTHQPSAGKGEISLRNFYTDFSQAATGALCSLGVHPWYLEHHQQLLDDLSRYAVLPNVLAIGECGLDRVCKTDWDLQRTVFRQQIIIANELHKPLIIHCVRAFDEFLKIIAENPPVVPVIVHGFNKKGDIAERLLNRGMCLSFGVAILNTDSPAADVLSRVAPDRFFLETDDTGRSISEIYKAAAAIRDTTIEDIILHLQKNFEHVFKYRI